jgi:hypothetical protein
MTTDAKFLNWSLPTPEEIARIEQEGRRKDAEHDRLIARAAAEDASVRTLIACNPVVMRDVWVWSVDWDGLRDIGTLVWCPCDTWTFFARPSLIPNRWKLHMVFLAAGWDIANEYTWRK